jgi:hypothetical protein
MNFLQSLKDRRAAFSRYLSAGATYTVGGDITSLSPMTIEHGGFVNTYASSGITRVAKPGWKPGLGSIAGVATSLPFWAMGVADGGVWGGVNAVLEDISVSSALAHYGHNTIKIGGVDTVVAGRYWGQQLVNNIGKNRYLGMGANAGNLMIRGAWGSLGHMAATSVFGNGILGNTLGIAGAAFGVRHAGKLSIAAGVGAIGAAAGYAGYSLAQVGYNHAIMRKNVQTAGDMSSFMTSGAHTMRARAVEAIQRSHLNTRSALGQEATYMHNPNNYFSPYRM